jgi:NAD(P)-dependent dehydrogenase (short-subunit alcohol dehydrogenase family)
MDAAAGAVIESFGKIGILVNNAGLIWGEHAENMPLEKWRMALDVNLTGAFLFCKRAGRRRIERGYGRIINIASINGIYGRTYR